MQRKRYTERELEHLFVLFTMNTPISEIERILLRPAEGIVKKIVSEQPFVEEALASRIISF